MNKNLFKEDVIFMKSVVKQVITICCVLIFLSVSAQAEVYTFKPYDNSGNSTDIMDLEHQKYYDWVINWTVPSEQIITGADLIFYDIYNWTSEDNDKLYLHIIDKIPSGLSSYALKTYITNGTTYTTKLYYGTDDQTINSDYWAAYPLIIDPPWTDPDDNVTSTPELTFAIPVSLLSELTDGSFGIAMDPDCHYYNSGVRLTIYTSTVPEPGMLVLLGSGLLGLAFYGRLRKK
jgi:hypothetical protein